MSSPRPDLLRLLGLPVFDNPEEFATAINLPFDLVNTLIVRADYHYKRRFIPKRNGEKRLIAEPSRKLKAVQAWILRAILDRLHASPHATAYIQGRSLLHNVGPHVGNRYFVCIDIEDFFPSVKWDAVRAVLETVGYGTLAATLIAKLCCFRGRLPQGAVTSPSLSNLTCGGLDRELAEIAGTRIVAYTRYADDITFSANNPTALRGLVNQVRDILRTHGFRLNFRKLKVFGPSKRCRVTGLTKNSAEPRFGIGTDKKRKMRAIMQKIARGQAAEGPYQTVAAVEGWLSFVRGHDRNSFEQMQKYWEQIQFKARFEALVSNIPRKVRPPLERAHSITIGPLGDLSALVGDFDDGEEIRVGPSEFRCSDGRIATHITFRFERFENTEGHPRLTSFRLQFPDETSEDLDEAGLNRLIDREVWRGALLAFVIPGGN